MRLKTLLLGCAAMVASAVVAVPAAQAFVGDWEYDNNPGGYEVLLLGDNSDGTTLRLRGTERYCGRPGRPYAEVRSVLLRNGTSGEQVEWWISDECVDGYVRVCVENWMGERACSTYRDAGWN